MDGLLLDSERLAQATFIAACRDIGYEPDLAIYQRCIGANLDTTRDILLQGFGSTFPYRAMHDRWRERYDAHVHHRPVDRKPGAAELLAALRAAGTPVALATSTQRVTTDAKLRLAGLDGYFSHRVCGGETSRGKPHPDPYLQACRLLNIEPGGCWALEDSITGTRAALAAGLTVFQIPDLIEPAGSERDLGQEILPSLVQVLERWQKIRT